jgi:hypothetical protein
MILKGSQRANGADLATHLMLALDNERVEIAEISGTVATDLHGAFAEMEAVAAGTKARNYLYSLSVNPSAPLTRAQYFEAIEDIEDRLGLSGQPRAIVFHVKDGREHAHVVWSKIDTATMKAVHMAYDHSKLCDLSCELAHKFGLNLPPGLKAWEAKRRTGKEALEATMAENAIAKETGITPEQRQTDITAAYSQTDTARAFQNALLEAGYILAQGDRRGFVVLDRFDKVHSLTRHVKGFKAKDIKNRLSALLPLPRVDEAKSQQRQHQQAIDDRHREAARKQAIDALAQRHTERRLPLEAKEQDLLLQHASERMALHAAQKTERQSFASTIVTAAGNILYRVRCAVLRLINRSPALRSILAPITSNPRLHPKERHGPENTALRERHDRERAMVEREKRAMAAVENRELKALEKAITRRVSDSETRSYDPAIHAREDLHRLHDHLLQARLEKERSQNLLQTFNERAAAENQKPEERDGKAPTRKRKRERRPKSN